jgi:hypothetical protein
MTTTAGHSFYIGPIGSFYNQVNDTGSWETLVLLWNSVTALSLVKTWQKYECLSRLVSNARYIRYRIIEPLNIEWCLTWWTIWCALLFTIFKFVPKKKKLGSTSPSKYIFLISPPSQIPRSKIEKIEKVCEQTSFISDMKLYTISLQNPKKKTHL